MPASRSVRYARRSTMSSASTGRRQCRSQYGVPTGRVAPRGEGHPDLRLDRRPPVAGTADLPVPRRDVRSQVPVGQPDRLRVAVQVRAPTHVLTDEDGSGLLLQLGREVGGGGKRHAPHEHEQSTREVDPPVAQHIEEATVGLVVTARVVAKVENNAADAAAPHPGEDLVSDAVDARLDGVVLHEKHTVAELAPPQRLVDTAEPHRVTTREAVRQPAVPLGVDGGRYW